MAGPSAGSAGGPGVIGGWPTGRIGRAGLVLLILALLTPLVFTGGVLFPFVVPKAVWFRLVAAGLAGLLLHAVLTRRATLAWRGDPVLPGLAGLLAVSVLAAVAGVAPLNSFFGGLERMGGVWTLAHVVVFYVALRSFVAPSRWRRVVRVLGGVLLVVAVSGLLDRYGLWLVGGSGRRAAGLTGNAGYLGATMLLTLAVVGVLVTRSRGVERHLWAAGAALAFVVLLMTETRAALVGIVAGGGLAAAAFVGLRGSGALRSAVAGLATALLLATIVAGVVRVHAVGGMDGESADTVTAGLQTAPSRDTRPGSTQARLYLWQKTLEAYSDRPVLGWGPENESAAIASRMDPGYYRIFPRGDRADRSHNTYLGLLVATGPLGLAAFLVLMAGILAALVAGHRAGRLGAGETALLVGATAGYAAFLVFWFEDLGGSVILTTVAAYAGTAATGRPLVELGPARERRSLPVLAVVWATLATMVAVQGVLPLRQAALLGRAEFDPELAVEQRLELYERALRSPATQRLQPILRHERYIQALFAEPDVRRDPFRVMRVLESAGVGLGAARAELRRDPWSDALPGRIASYAMVIYQTTGDEAYADEARDALRAAIDVAPGRIRNRHLLSQIELTAGRPDRAEALLRETLASHDGFGETHHFLAVVALERDRPGEALEWAEEAARLAYRPTGPDLHLRLGSALEAAGRPGDAARVYRLFLETSYRAIAGEEAPRPGSLQPGDAEILVRLPVALLRAGDAEAAVDAALLLEQFVPALGPELHGFVRDAREGRPEAWVGRETLVDPARVRRVMSDG